MPTHLCQYAGHYFPDISAESYKNGGLKFPRIQSVISLLLYCTIVHRFKNFASFKLMDCRMTMEKCLLSTFIMQLLMKEISLSFSTGTVVPVGVLCNMHDNHENL